ncbi:MAG: methyltransferase domain-containing protein [Acidobacteria bacterium]|nr:methyltransferase domain-containing protein [Acidobacteriota bacterium]
MSCSAIDAATSKDPFDRLADGYDEIFTNSAVGRAQRSQVWEEADRLFRPGQRILEINCGTGVDAMHLASRGVEVVACDASPRMIATARARLAEAVHRAGVDFRVLATEEIALLKETESFDGLLSNFAGLNCVEDLSAAARSLALRLKPGAKALLCLFGPCCLWETAWYLSQGNFQKAFRRFRRSGVSANLGTQGEVKVHYFSVKELELALAPYFRLERWNGVGILVPPSHLEFLAQRFPTALRLAFKIDRHLAALPGVRGLADHMLLTFERCSV